jgi:hypothetical protein
MTSFDVIREPAGLSASKLSFGNLRVRQAASYSRKSEDRRNVRTPNAKFRLRTLRTSAVKPDVYLGDLDV